MKFIANILPILTMDDRFFFGFDNTELPLKNIKSESICQIQNLFKMLASKAYGFNVPCFYDFMQFHSNVNEHLEKIRLIKTTLNKKNVDLLFKWVTKPRADCRRKILFLHEKYTNVGPELIRKIKKVNFLH